MTGKDISKPPRVKKHCVPLKQTDKIANKQRRRDFTLLSGGKVMPGRWAQAKLARALAILCFAASILSPAAAAESSNGRIELKLKIVPFISERGYRLWEVELTDSRGNVAARKTAAGSDTARFRDLAPDIYLICLYGARQSQYCQSFDLIPPPDSRNHVFDETIAAPGAGSAPRDAYTVSLATLSIPGKARDEYRRSIDARRKGMLQRSVDHLRRAIEIFPRFAHALCDLGAYYHRHGEYQEAIRCMSEAVEAEPGYFPGWLNLSKSYLASGDYARAGEAGRRALELRPKSPQVNSQLAFTYYYQKDFEAARQYFLRLAEVDPESASLPHLYLARIAFTRNDRAEGMRYLSEFVALHPYGPQSLKYRMVLRNLQRQISTGTGNAPSADPEARPER